MAPSTRNYNRVHGLKVAILTAAFIFSFFAIVLTKSVDSKHSSHSESSGLQQQQRVLGSRPPGCENRCLNCRPCIPTLVIPSHHKKKRFCLSSYKDEDDNYYLLSWKCKCGKKLFQP